LLAISNCLLDVLAALWLLSKVFSGAPSSLSLSLKKL
jgi:hypothetical protein